MRNEENSPGSKPQKTAGVLAFFQIIPGITIFICAVFGIFVGLRFLTFIDHEESRRIASTEDSIPGKWFLTGFEQLQQMNATIKEELDLILDQRRENQSLQEKVRHLTAEIAEKANQSATPPPSTQGVNQ